MSEMRLVTSKMRILFMVIGLSGLGGTAVLAHPGPRGYGRHEQGGMRQLQEMLGTLGLTPDQQTAIDKLVATHRDDARTEGSGLMAAQKALADQVHAETIDEGAIRQAAATLAAAQADRAVAEATLLSQIRAQLTASQRAQFQHELQASSEGR